MTAIDIAANLTINPAARRLTPSEITQYDRLGYIVNLPVFADAALADLQAAALGLLDLLPTEIDVNRINMWHKANRWYYDICRTPAILDYVEDLLGPDFYQWGGQFFVKKPGDAAVVPWHQDAQY
jgi:non-heme Fe2+,alpha-ketoglutarate-dependent halogenase